MALPRAHQRFLDHVLGGDPLRDWGPLSQPYPEITVDDLSWVAMFAPIVAGMAVGALGLSRFRGGAGRSG